MELISRYYLLLCQPWKIVEHWLAFLTVPTQYTLHSTYWYRNTAMLKMVTRGFFSAQATFIVVSYWSHSHLYRYTLFWQSNAYVYLMHTDEPLKIYKFTAISRYVWIFIYIWIHPNPYITRYDHGTNQLCENANDYFFCRDKLWMQFFCKFLHGLSYFDWNGWKYKNW